jgi:hypothetical protein
MDGSQKGAVATERTTAMFAKTAITLCLVPNVCFHFQSTESGLSGHDNIRSGATGPYAKQEQIRLCGVDDQSANHGPICLSSAVVSSIAV